MIYILPIIIFLLDWFSKYLAITHLQVHTPLPVTPFFNFYLTFNPGISFSMLQANTSYDVCLLIVIACLICGFIIYAFAKEKDKWIRFALMLVLGGAFGNIWDRLRYHVVVDFLDFHIGNYHWPAFNVADSAICIGVMIMLWQTLRRKK